MYVAQAVPWQHDVNTALLVCSKPCDMQAAVAPCAVALSPGSNPPRLQVTNPLYLWQFWSADARHARACFARHNSIMDEKVAALLKVPPPDYTIAGTLWETGVSASCPTIADPAPTVPAQRYQTVCATTDRVAAQRGKHVKGVLRTGSYPVNSVRV